MNKKKYYDVNNSTHYRIFYLTDNGCYRLYNLFKIGSNGNHIKLIPIYSTSKNKTLYKFKIIRWNYKSLQSEEKLIFCTLRYDGFYQTKDAFRYKELVFEQLST